jgi:hypothetical protein
MSHYAIMSAQEESVNRRLPIPLVAYHLYLKTIHSGMTGQEILSMDDAQFGQFFAESFQITCDAGLFPYEKDFIPSLSLSFEEGIFLTASGTEDLVHSSHPFSFLPHSPDLFFAGLALHGDAIQWTHDSKTAPHQSEW